MTALVVLLLLVGFVLLAVEVLVIPGFGVAGIAGVASLAAGGILSWRSYGPLWGLGVVSGTILASLALLWIVARTKVGRSMSLQTTLEGTTADETLESLVGKTGQAVSVLRPSGAALIDGERYPVLSEGLFLDKGSLVKVIRVDAGRLVVEPIDPVESEADGPGGRDEPVGREG